MKAVFAHFKYKVNSDRDVIHVPLVSHQERERAQTDEFLLLDIHQLAFLFALVQKKADGRPKLISQILN